ncbi:hypothetical protein [Brevundimonas goettingensis]|uniref:Uncharacterized protein n=1 Tax=Brevundimonas goettingensis TaxID=2774190 RepID=A0A975C0T4_9CAUL|nr:hypothetical protein [Brevundimonas goettingensis]QTC91708.1 hypothetical protein IFJ75_01875 [Brevundimonas goettingensis]
MEEAHRAFSHGFQLDAASISGLCARIDSHFAKLGPDNGKVSFRVRLKDESIQSIPDIESLLSLPNVGRKEVIAITISKERGIGDDRYSSSICFSDPGIDEDLDKSITFSVSGPNLDWVRSLKVDLEEFISGVSRPNYAVIFSKVRPFLMGSVILSMLATIVVISGIANAPSVSNEEILRLKSELAAAKDTIDDSLVVYARWNSVRSHDSLPFWMVLPTVVALILTSISRKSIESIFKSKIFYFGGMLSVISQRRTMHSIFWVGIVLAIAVGVGVNYITKYLMP